MPVQYSLNLTDVPTTVELPMQIHNGVTVPWNFSGTFCYNDKEYRVSVRRADGYLTGNICMDDNVVADLGECIFEQWEDEKLDEKLNESWEDYIKKIKKDETSDLKKATRAALYVRVSAEDQAREGFSLDAQTEQLKAYCSVNNWEISDIYREEGYSCRNTDRPEYKRMMDDSDKWDVLLVLKMDRIHCNSANFTLMMDDFGRKGKEFNSTLENIDSTTAIGRFVIDLIKRIAQLEDEKLDDGYNGKETEPRMITDLLEVHLDGVGTISFKIQNKRAKFRKIFNNTFVLDGSAIHGCLFVDLREVSGEYRIIFVEIKTNRFVSTILTGMKSNEAAIRAIQVGWDEFRRIVMGKPTTHNITIDGSMAKNNLTILGKYVHLGKDAENGWE